MDHQITRPRKRRRVSSSEDVPDRPETNTRVSTKAMATQQVTTSATPTLTSLFEDFRSIITCKICFRLLYEPFTLACGHTHCYSCLCEWFGRTEDRRKTCPDCRAAVKQAPAPAYTVRELTQKYITHPECLPEGESTAQHEKARAEESAIVEAERGVLAGAGLFRGMFNKPERLPAMVDGEDGVSRCPYCAWELEPGEGTRCPHCGGRHDGSDDSDEYDSEDDMDDMDAIEYPHNWPPHDEDLDEEIDDDDMDDEDALQMLDRDPFGPPPGAAFETGGETYYVSSDNDDVASVQELGRRRRRSAPREDQGVIDMMRAEGQARRDVLSRQLIAHEQNLINGGHIPHRRRLPRGSTSPGHPSDVDSDEEEDYDSEGDTGSLDDFVVREDEESTIQHEPEFSSMYNTSDDEADITVSIQPGGSDDSNRHSSSSEDVTRRDRATHRYQQDVSNRHAARGTGRGRGRGAPIMVSDPSSSSGDDDSDNSASPPPRGPQRRTGRAPAARTEEDSAEEAIQRVLDETDHNSSDEESAEEAIQRVLEETEGVEGSSSEEEEDEEDELPVRRTRQRR